MPSFAFAGGTAFPLWDNLYITNGTSEGIYYTIQGDAPDRDIVFEYYLSDPSNDSEYYHFEVTFFENGPGLVQYQYFEIADGGASSTIGVQSKHAHKWICLSSKPIFRFLDSSSGPFIQYSYSQPDSELSGIVLHFDTNQDTYSGYLLCGPTQCTLNQACVQDLCVTRGSLSFTADWSRDDGRGYIIVRSPLNDTIYYGHPTSNSSLDGGQHEEVGNGTEVDNIYWPLNSTVPKGIYSICFSTGTLFAGNDTSPVTVTIEIRPFQYAIETMTRTFNMSTKDLSECNQNSDTYIGSYSTGLFSHLFKCLQYSK